MPEATATTHQYQPGGMSLTTLENPLKNTQETAKPGTAADAKSILGEADAITEQRQQELTTHRHFTCYVMVAAL